MKSADVFSKWIEQQKLLDSFMPPKQVMETFESSKQWQEQMDLLKPPKHITDIFEANQHLQEQTDLLKPPKHIIDIFETNQRLQKQMDLLHPPKHITDILEANRLFQKQMDLLRPHTGLIALIEAQNKFNALYSDRVSTKPFESQRSLSVMDEIEFPLLHPAITLGLPSDEIIGKWLSTNRPTLQIEEEPVDNLLAVNYDLLSLRNISEKAHLTVTPRIIRAGVVTLKQIIADIQRNNEKMFTLHHRKFEEIIAELFSKKGYTVELTAQTRDGGRDLIALRSDNGIPLKYLVECKRNRKDRPVGIGVIRSFCDVISREGANKGIIFTTSRFSKDAKKRQAETPFLLDLKDHNDIILWVNDYILNF